MRFIIALLLLTLPLFGQIRYSPTGFTGPFISTVTNQASAQTYLGVSGGGTTVTMNAGQFLNNTNIGPGVPLTNVIAYSSGTTNRPFRVYSTNGEAVYVDKDGVLYATNASNSIAGYLPLAGGTMTGALTLEAASLLKFGGSTASFPALKRSTTELQVKLADDSDFSSLRVSSLNIQPNAGLPYLYFNGSSYIYVSGGRFVLSGGLLLSAGNVTFWDYGTTHGNNGDQTNDIFQVREAVGVMGQRYSTTPQTLRIYGTAANSTQVSPGTNYVRASLSSTATDVTLASESGGTGADDVNINLTPAGLGGVVISGPTTTASRIKALSIKTTDYGILITDHIIVGNHATVAFTVTLPTLAAATIGREFIIKNKGAAIVTVEGDGAETIDGNLNAALNQYDSVTLVSDGTQWLIL